MYDVLRQTLYDAIVQTFPRTKMVSDPKLDALREQRVQILRNRCQIKYTFWDENKKKPMEKIIKMWSYMAKLRKLDKLRKLKRLKDDTG